MASTHTGMHETHSTTFRWKSTRACATTVEATSRNRRRSHLRRPSPTHVSRLDMRGTNARHDRCASVACPGDCCDISWILVRSSKSRTIIRNSAMKNILALNIFHVLFHMSFLSMLRSLYRYRSSIRLISIWFTDK